MSVGVVVVGVVVVGVVVVGVVVVGVVVVVGGVVTVRFFDAASTGIALNNKISVINKTDNFFMVVIPFGSWLPFFSGKALSFASQSFNWFAFFVEL